MESLNQNNVSLPDDLKELYPFTPKNFKTSSGHQLSYVDEGEGEAIVLLHGNPTWSFAYRELIKTLSPHFRVIVPDHIGMGLSEKPQDYTYQLKDHVENTHDLLERLQIERYHMVVHDWGGAIGAGLSVKTPEALLSWVILNTAAFTSAHIPWRINICRNSFGEQLIRRLNAFAAPATVMAATKPLEAKVKKGYLYPYNNYQNRIATARFVRDIPMDDTHPSFSTLHSIEEKLPTLKCPKLILWGEKDFCFNGHFLKRWQELYPKAQVVTYPKGGHYIFEDESEDVKARVLAFFQEHKKEGPSV